MPGQQSPGPAHLAAAPVDRAADDRVAAGERAGDKTQVDRGDGAIEARVTADAIDAAAVELRICIEGRAAAGEIDGPGRRIDDACVVGETDAAADGG